MRTFTLIFILLFSIVTLAQTEPPQAPQQPVIPEAQQRELLAVAALEGLMSAPPERALPLVHKVLNSQHSNQVKKHALFVLGQIDLPEAQAQLLELATDNGNNLQPDAIRMLGINGNSAGLQALRGLYPEAPQHIKEVILDAYLIANDSESIYQLALNASTEQELDTAVRKLGAMGAHEKLRQLSERGNHSKSLVEAYAIAGDLHSLQQLAQNPDSDMQIHAINSIGIVDDDNSRQVLLDIYRKSPAQDVKQAALQGLMIGDHDDAIFELYKSTDDLDEKRQLLRTLTMMDSDAAFDAIDAALDGNQP